MRNRVERVCELRGLSAMYAPNARGGRYFVCSEIYGWFCGCWTLLGHVVRIRGKLVRVWMN